jgi:(1->4)-alpha-D-glucan 1-alpha-D-glucosylmutase
MRDEGRGTGAITATCRLQLHKEFTLGSVREIVPYLHRLGISHVYSSPILMARPGSQHGYDVVDPTRLNPELGTDDEWRAVIDELHARHMGWVLDIVPNHMGTGSANPFWEDVLARGRGSPYASWFDIEWEARATSPAGGSLADEDAGDRVLLPVLGDELRRVIDRGEIAVAAEGGRYRVRYFENSFPVGPGTIDEDTLRRAERRDGDALETVLHAQHYRLTFWRRGAREINYRRFFDINELVALRMEDPRVFEQTHRLVLSWVDTGMLDGLRIDHVDGLREPVEYLERLWEGCGMRDAGCVEGSPSQEQLRIPHPTSRIPHFFIEKILSPGEQLRADWPVDGTTGYEFLNDLESIFVDPRGRDAIDEMYRRRIRRVEPGFDFAEEAIRGKLLILRTSLYADVARLARLAQRAAPRGSGLGLPQLQAAIVELIACLPVYRTYIDRHRQEPDEPDARVLARALARARERGSARPAALDLLERLLTVSGTERRRLTFVLRFQQTSGPATAKGVEDTALYRYVPLVSLNEVGGEPDRPLDDAVDRLHRANRARAERWPLALVSTNTHDTKRSADVRARIDVLSEMPDEWTRIVTRWRRLHRGVRTPVRGRLAPDASTEYLLYQTLLGMWPPATAVGDEGELVADSYYFRPAVPGRPVLDDLRQRLTGYMVKASREAKTQTSWTDPDEEWERALGSFIDRLFGVSPSADGGESAGGPPPMLLEVADLAARIARFGMWNALSRLVVHYTVPGTPDLYQGDELWNLSLVDPDNRRPVDFALRSRLLDEVDRAFSAGGAERGDLLRHLAESPGDGRIKLHLTHRLLATRRERADLFTRGSYEPARVEGPAARHVFAFMRRLGAEAALVVVPRLLHTAVTGLGARASAAADAERSLSLAIPHQIWQGTRIVLDDELADTSWLCALSGVEVFPDRAGHVAPAKQTEGIPPLSSSVEAPTGPVSTRHAGTAVAYRQAAELTVYQMFRALPVALLLAERPDV